MQRRSDSPNNVEELITVVTGTGGIGKTQLVRKYVNENRSKYDNNVFWINADKEESIVESFKTLANEKLCISTKGANGAEKKINLIIEDVYDFFVGKKFLLVYDNVESMENIRKFLVTGTDPNRPFFIITSRRQEWHEAIKVIKLKELQLAEATAFVSAMLSDDKDSQEDIAFLAKDLQCFPLALRQATSYISYQRNTGNYTISNYLTNYKKQREELLDSKIFQNGVSTYTKTTFTTWKNTINTIEKHPKYGALAIKALNIIAYFAPDNIHRDSLIDLVDEFEAANEEYCRPEVFRFQCFRQKKLLVDKEKMLIPAIDLLVKYSMISSQNSQSTLSVHRVVQEVMQVTLKSQNREQMVLLDALLLIKKLMKRVAHTRHAVSVFQHALAYADLVKLFHELPNIILMNLITDFNIKQALLFGDLLLAKLGKIFGYNHSIVEKIKCNINYAQKFGNQTIGPVIKDKSLHLMYDKLYRMRLYVFGENDVDTVAVHFMIGCIFMYMRNISDAVIIFEDVVEKFKRNHKENLETRALEKIGIMYLGCGLHEKSLEVYKILHEQTKLKFGKNNPISLNVRNWMGCTLLDQKKYKEALEVFEEIYENKTELGEENEVILSAMENIGYSHFKQRKGNYDEIFKILRRAHSQRVKLHGERHPNTLKSLNGIGVTMLGQKNYTEALQLFHEIYKNKNEIGDDNEIIIEAMENIGGACYNLGKYEESLNMYIEVHMKRARLLGEHHPETVRVFKKLTNTLKRKGDRKGSEKVYAHQINW